MVFSNLGSHEKDAFFTLLDEYFASRPDVFGGQQGASATQTATRAMQAAPGVMSAGIGKATAFGKSFAQSHQSQPAHADRSTHADEPEESTMSSVSNRIKAFSSSHTPSHDSGSGGAGSRASMTQVKKFGDVDMSSGTKMLGSLRHSSAAKNAPFTPPRTAPAFAPKQNTFSPPPVRHAASTPPAAEPDPEPEEAQGEWVEMMYDYTSGEPGDLQCSEGQRILLVERTSDDWWTGELNGKRGLFPASYCKML
ncbi:hypothetical protein BD626DRAFT_482100 [Schizophyllum amplum]|uniref:SH3 domain-containing protein n=1 Tax=Schizophyllum amplum TaxID=97359 RepID=A0A550CUT9_9AGAR|nr:hypothetical protein BD626DRAFT_482100 [Auriculariopsis ampla]